jgi:hypothetical protein
MKDIQNKNLTEVKAGSIPIPEIVYHQENEKIKEVEL